MNKHTISIEEIKHLQECGVSTFEKKSNTPRGCTCVSADNIKVGDEVVINNYFTLVTE